MGSLFSLGMIGGMLMGAYEKYGYIAIYGSASNMDAKFAVCWRVLTGVEIMQGQMT